jgi:DNA replication licensing factor MCM4
VEKFARYINYAKTNIKPVITEEAGKALVDFYCKMRKTSSEGGSNIVTFTTRQLESMIRLSEAHAKMRLSNEVQVADVEEANRLVLSALQTAAVDPRTGKIDLDLVTTGISAFGRQVHEEKRRAVRALIEASERPTLKWAELLRAFQAQSDQVIVFNVAD